MRNQIVLWAVNFSQVVDDDMIEFKAEFPLVHLPFISAIPISTLIPHSPSVVALYRFILNAEMECISLASINTHISIATALISPLTQ